MRTGNIARPPHDSADKTTKTSGRLLRVAGFVLVPLLFIALLAVGLFKSSSPRSAVGSQAPEIDLPLLGRPGRLSSRDLHGRPVIVNFWASWCIPCRQEAPDLLQAAQRYGDRVSFVGVNIQDSKKDALEFAKEFGIEYTLARDVDQTIARRFGVKGIPETFFIDHSYRFYGFSEGERVGARGNTVVLGAISSARLRGQIEEMLARIDAQEGRSG